MQAMMLRIAVISPLWMGAGIICLFAKYAHLCARYLPSPRYNIFNLKNREFTFDVDSSGVPREFEGALYFVGMSSDGID